MRDYIKHFIRNKLNREFIRNKMNIEIDTDAVRREKDVNFTVTPI